MKRRKSSDTSRANEVIFGLVALLLTFTIVLFSFGLRDIYEAPQAIEISIKDVRPSYEYLKSITVEIFGQAVEDEDEYMCQEEDGNSIDKGYERRKQLRTMGWKGTGVVINYKEGYTYILTNAHVAGGGKADAMIYVDNDGKRKLTEVYAVHSILDMAVLKVEGKIKYKVPVKGFSVAYPQDKVYMVGHHLGRPYIYGEGVFAGYDEIYDLIQIPSIYGNSGSGVIDKDGNLVALIFAGSMINFFQIDNTHGLAVDGDSIRLYLEKLNVI